MQLSPPRACAGIIAESERAWCRGGRSMDDLERMQQARTVYDALGDATFRALVEAFYRRVEADPVLRPLFPADLSAGREKQYLFLVQYFGGPATYTERYGHPMLRRRHFP